MNISCYLLKGIVYIPTSYAVESSFHYDSMPLASVPVDQTKKLHEAIQAAIARGSPPISRDEVRSLSRGKSHPMVNAAGLRSWSALDRQLTGLWNISEKDCVYKIRVNRALPTRGWSEDRDKAVQFPAGTPAEEVIARLIAMMQERE